MIIITVGNICYFTFYNYKSITHGLNISLENVGVNDVALHQILHYNI